MDNYISRNSRGRCNQFSWNHTRILQKKMQTCLTYNYTKAKSWTIFYAILTSIQAFDAVLRLEITCRLFCNCQQVYPLYFFIQYQMICNLNLCYGQFCEIYHSTVKTSMVADCSLSAGCWLWAEEQQWKMSVHTKKKNEGRANKVSNRGSMNFSDHFVFPSHTIYYEGIMWRHA